METSWCNSSHPFSSDVLRSQRKSWTDEVIYWKVRTCLYVMKYAYKQTWIGTSHAHNGLTYFLNGEDMRTLIFKFLSFYIQGKKKKCLGGNCTLLLTGKWEIHIIVKKKKKHEWDGNYSKRNYEKAVNALWIENSRKKSFFFFNNWVVGL